MLQVRRRETASATGEGRDRGWEYVGEASQQSEDGAIVRRHGGERLPGFNARRKRERTENMGSHLGLEFAMLRPRIHCLRFRSPREKGRELPTVRRSRKAPPTLPRPRDAPIIRFLERERKVHCSGNGQSEYTYGLWWCLNRKRVDKVSRGCRDSFDLRASYNPYFFKYSIRCIKTW